MKISKSSVSHKNAPNQNCRYKLNLASHSQRIVNKWNAIKDEFVQRYPEIKEETLAVNKKNYKKFLELVAKKTNRSANDVRMEILNW